MVSVMAVVLVGGVSVRAVWVRVGIGMVQVGIEIVTVGLRGEEPVARVTTTTHLEPDKAKATATAPGLVIRVSRSKPFVTA